MADQDWRKNVLLAIGAPATKQNLAFLEGWAHVENTKAAYNPLATTLDMPGATTLSGNPDGVKNYRTFQQGVTATARTIRGYPAVVAALRRNKPELAAPGLASMPGHKWAPFDPGYVGKVSRAFGDALLNESGSSLRHPLRGVGLDDIPIVGGTLDGARDAGGAVVDTGQAIAGGIQTVIQTVFDVNTWRRGGLIMAGGIFVFAGLLLLARSIGSPANMAQKIAPDGTLAGDAAALLPTGRAMKAAAAMGPAKKANLRKTTKVRPLDDPGPRARRSGPSAQDRDGVPF